jgi:hypothetical protein
MNRHAALTPRSNLRRDIPASTALQIDQACAALASLREEERRLERLGLDEPLHRCREQLRYWEFLSALFALPAAPRFRARPTRGSR